MIGVSLPMRRLYERIEAFAPTDAPVLVRGETGVGKELTVRALHALSGRSRGPLAPVNAGALPLATLQSELFGHARGAFTGAQSSRDGKLVSASGGSLFLDEIESIPEPAQMQLLRVLEDGLVVPLGGDRPRPVNIRLLAATKTDLREMVRLGRMREDFYHRVTVLTLDVPPLRERRDDIPLLIAHFLVRAAARNRVAPPRIPAETLDEMVRAPWPGNVRELKNTVERMVLTASRGVAGPFQQPGAEASEIGSMTPGGRLRAALDAAERQAVMRALNETGGRLGDAALILGVSPATLDFLMQKHGLSTAGGA